MNDRQNLKLELLKARDYDVNSAAKCYDFVIGENNDTPVAAEQYPDGVYLMQDDGRAVLFTGQSLNADEQSRCTGVGVKLGSKSLVVAMHDAYDGNTELTEQSGGKRFITSYADAVADWDGVAGTEDMRPILNDNIELSDTEYIPSLGQLYFILLHFKAINEALAAAGGSEVQRDWYWSSTECSSTRAWLLYLGIGTANGNAKAAGQLRVRAVSAFLS